jgi:hypothetical protein
MRKKTTIADLEKRIDEPTHANTRTQQDLAFLAGAIERLLRDWIRLTSSTWD